MSKSAIRLVQELLIDEKWEKASKYGSHSFLQDVINDEQFAWDTAMSYTDDLLSPSLYFAAYGNIAICVVHGRPSREESIQRLKKAVRDTLILPIQVLPDGMVRSEKGVIIEGTDGFKIHIEGTYEDIMRHVSTVNSNRVQRRKDGAATLAVDINNPLPAVSRGIRKGLITDTLSKRASIVEGKTRTQMRCETEASAVRMRYEARVRRNESALADLKKAREVIDNIAPISSDIRYIHPNVRTSDNTSSIRICFRCSRELGADRGVTKCANKCRLEFHLGCNEITEKVCICGCQIRKWWQYTDGKCTQSGGYPLHQVVVTVKHEKVVTVPQPVVIDTPVVEHKIRSPQGWRSEDVSYYERKETVVKRERVDRRSIKNKRYNERLIDLSGSQQK